MLYMFVFSLLVVVLCCTSVSVLMNCKFQFQKKKKRYLFAEELESNLLPSDEDEVPFARHGLCRT